jgi:hypothetical protein
MVRLGNLESELRIMSNIAVLYISDYLKNVYQINLFHEPFKIE